MGLARQRRDTTSRRTLCLGQYLFTVGLTSRNNLMEFSTVLDHAAASPLYNGYSTHRFLYVNRYSTADDTFLAFFLIVLLFASN
jgi:hypothetical protein